LLTIVQEKDTIKDAGRKGTGTNVLLDLPPGTEISYIEKLIR
jgi:hypothetical protein